MFHVKHTHSQESPAPFNTDCIQKQSLKISSHHFNKSSSQKQCFLQKQYVRPLHPYSLFPPKKICFDESGRCATIANESGSSFVENLWTSFIKGAVSSFGRALPWHGRGEEFESPTVHVFSFFCPHSSTDRTVPS